MNHDDIDPLKAIEYIYRNGQAYAEAKAEVAYLEHFRKTKLALLMKEAQIMGNSSAVSQDREAHAHPEYIELLEGIREAVGRAEGLRWGLIAAQARIDVFRSMEASNRMTDRAVA